MGFVAEGVESLGKALGGQRDDAKAQGYFGGSRQATEDYLTQQAQRGDQYAARQAPQMNMGQRQEGRELAYGDASRAQGYTAGMEDAYGKTGSAYKLAEQAALGKGPSVAELQQQQGIEDAMRSHFSMASSARGGALGAAAAGQSAAQQAAQLQAQGVNAAGRLRAQEMMQARAEMGQFAGQLGNIRGQQAGLSNQARQIGISQQGMDLSEQQTLAQNQLAQQAQNDQMRQFYEQIGYGTRAQNMQGYENWARRQEAVESGNAAGIQQLAMGGLGAGGAAMTALPFLGSDENAKRDLQFANAKQASAGMGAAAANPMAAPKMFQHFASMTGRNLAESGLGRMAQDSAIGQQLQGAGQRLLNAPGVSQVAGAIGVGAPPEGAGAMAPASIGPASGAMATANPAVGGTSGGFGMARGLLGRLASGITGKTDMSPANIPPPVFSPPGSGMATQSGPGFGAGMSPNMSTQSMPGMDLGAGVGPDMSTQLMGLGRINSDKRVKELRSEMRDMLASIPNAPERRSIWEPKSAEDEVNEMVQRKVAALNAPPSNRGAAEIDGLLNAFKDSASTYTYKDPGLEPRSDPTGGRYPGIVAQRVEKAPGLGRQLVSDTPNGKVIEGGAALSATMAGLGRQQQQIDQIKDILGSIPAAPEYESPWVEKKKKKEEDKYATFTPTEREIMKRMGGK